ncbi:hypothetical protein BU15DRAFT_10917, partial [Melanogaster broomeanus]
RWARMWAKSPRYQYLNTIDPKMLTGSFTKLTSSLSRRHTSILIWLHTRHTLLNAHLHRMARSDTPDCPHCPGIAEDVGHFIFGRPQYAHERHILSDKLRRYADQLPYLLTSSKVVPHLLNYVNNTGRFKPTFGDV